MSYSIPKKYVLKLLKLAAVASYLTCSLRSLTSRIRGLSGDDLRVAADPIRRLDSLLCVGDHAAAESLVRALLARRRALDFAEDLNRLARTYRDRGQLSAAELLLRSSVGMHHQARGEKPARDPERLSHHVKSLNQLADLYRTMGNYPSAVLLLRQALEIDPPPRGCQDRRSLNNSVRTLSHLADLKRHMGDYASAESLLHRAVESCRAALGEDHPDYATAMNYLANLYRSMGNHASAEPLLRLATEIHRNALGEDHPHHAASLTNLANLHRSMGDHASAEPLLCRATEIYRIALGGWHREYARSLARKAYLHKVMRKNEEALMEYKEVIEIYAMNNICDLESVKFLLNTIVLLITVGRAAEALPLLDRWRSVENVCTGQCFSIASEGQRTEYLEALKNNVFVAVSIILRHLDGFPAAIRSGMDLVLQRKALGSEALAMQRDVLLAGRYPALQSHMRQLAALRMQIGRKSLEGPGPEGLESHLRGLAEWNARKQELEAELARQIPEMNLERKMRSVDRFAIARRLPKETVLIEFLLVHVYDVQPTPRAETERWKPPVYVALIIPAGRPDDVRMIDLGEADQIDRLIADFRAQVFGEAGAELGRDMTSHGARTAPFAQGDPGSALRAALFDPVIRYLGGRTRLLLSPDGDLNRLPFEILPTDSGRRLIDDYQISYLSCGRDVLRFGVSVDGGARSPLVVADPDFDLEEPTIRRPDRFRSALWSRLLARFRRAGAEPASALTSAAPIRRSRDLERGRETCRFDRLPGTDSEGRAIADLLGVRAWLGPAALEGALKAQCRSPRIIHLATHGFFLRDQQRGPATEGPGVLEDPGGAPGRLAGRLPENPMLRSGLALAGANTWLKSGPLPEAAEDGLLTAEDITGLDLSATELVVLSACETGLGEIHVGEGVLGLRRAFVLAGAKALVMSLWKVPDEPTRELMDDFYRRLLAGQGRAAALREAQLAMKTRYPDPYYWGAFICQGDPLPLSTTPVGAAARGLVSDKPRSASPPTESVPKVRSC
jgi:tetratricopeptide (TPR) repeat protein